MLRQQLDDLAILDTKDQLPQIEHLRKLHGHTLDVLTNVKSDLGYNCVRYALRVHDDAWLTSLLRHIAFGPAKRPDIHMDTGFIRHLVDASALVETTQATGIIVVYHNREKCLHIGRIVSQNRIRSKWGNGHLYEHEYLQTPLSYGSDFRFYADVEVDVVLDQFWIYAQTKGFAPR